MRLIVSALDLAGKETWISESVHKIAIDVIPDPQKESLIMQLAEEIISTLKAYTFRKL